MSKSDTVPTGPLWSQFRSDASASGSDNAPNPGAPVSGIGGVDLRTVAARNDGHVSSSDGALGGAGSVSGGRRGASGGRSADGNAVRSARGRGDHAGPCFSVEVGPDGYAWWYVDGVSDDGEKAVSVIGFIGSVFSPWYKWSGRRDPSNHCCINVATYGRGGRFTMTDRGRAALRQTSDTLTVGPSRMHWTGRQLVIDIDEMGAPPLVTPVRGRITLTPAAITDVEVCLTPDGVHLWRPFSPTARIEVDLTQGQCWQGHGYFDANFGTRALEADFDYWTWGRFPVSDGALCFYDATRRDGTELALGLHIGLDGTANAVTPPPKAHLPRTLWALARSTRADAGFKPTQRLSMLDAPFYSRSLVETKLNGEISHGVHEALDLTRFRQPLLKPMLALRVPRRANWRFRDDAPD
jgi:carotenoid 1,2-hydratase